ncbi:hypothetical protein Pfo_021872 [Paulownia fortunei]|nr:hypothetical protein Pfo_021872 [Paulownia fortunei]
MGRKDLKRQVDEIATELGKQGDEEVELEDEESRAGESEGEGNADQDQEMDAGDKEKSEEVEHDQVQDLIDEDDKDGRQNQDVQSNKSSMKYLLTDGESSSLKFMVSLECVVYPVKYKFSQSSLANVWIEVDAMIILLIHNTDPPTLVVSEVPWLDSFITNPKCKFSYREANQAADFLPNQACNDRNSGIWTA